MCLKREAHLVSEMEMRHIVGVRLCVNSSGLRSGWLLVTVVVTPCSEQLRIRASAGFHCDSASAQNRGASSQIANGLSMAVNARRELGRIHSVSYVQRLH